MMNRTFRKQWLLALVLGISGTAMGEAPAVPDAKTLIEKSIAATGGEKALADMKSLRLKATLTVEAQNIEGTIEVFRKPGKTLVTAEIPAIGVFKSGIVGDIAFETSDAMGSKLLNEEEKNRLLDGLDPHRQIARYKALKDLTVTGPEKVGESETWVLTGAKDNGDKETHWIDAKSWLTVKSEMVVRHAMGKMPVTIEFQDYKKVDNLVFPMTVKQRLAPMTTVMKFTEVEVNPEIADEKFALPPDVLKMAENAKKAAPTTQANP